MIEESLKVCPVHLLFKDNKGWSPDKGGVAPTQHVAGGNKGMNLHISEVVSDIIEPMVGRVEGGKEVISTEDTLASFEDINVRRVGWTNTSWLEGQVVDSVIACGKCSSEDNFVWNEDNPDPCRCENDREDKRMGAEYKEGQWGKHDSKKHDSTLDGMDGMKGRVQETSNAEDNVYNEKEDSPKLQRCTHTYVRTLRRLRWEKQMGWDTEDEDRRLDSTEVLKEDLQDFTVPTVIVGADVVSLYPNLNVDQVVKRIEEEVIRTDMKFEEVDYVEATRYLVLNWTVEQSRNSRLRRVLPWRRGKRGTKPGIIGAGPRGAARGDQEQWEFPHIKLEEWEKKEILAAVIRVATEAMFKNTIISLVEKLFIKNGEDQSA